MALPEHPPLDPPPKHVTPHVPLLALYKTFFWVGMFSFGGGLSSWLHREIVDIRGWMTDDQFFSGYSLTHVLPGVNSSNLAVYIGQHLRGTPGAVVALLALLTGPFFVVIGAAVAYRYLLQVPGFQAAVAGIAIGMLIRLGFIAARKATTGVAPVLIMLAIFVAIGFLRWPLVPVVLVMAPISIAVCWPRKPKANA